MEDNHKIRKALYTSGLGDLIEFIDKESGANSDKEKYDLLGQGLSLFSRKVKNSNAFIFDAKDDTEPQKALKNHIRNSPQYDFSSLEKVISTNEDPSEVIKNLGQFFKKYEGSFEVETINSLIDEKTSKVALKVNFSSMENKIIELILDSNVIEEDDKFSFLKIIESNLLKKVFSAGDVIKEIMDMKSGQLAKEDFNLYIENLGDDFNQLAGQKGLKPNIKSYKKFHEEGGSNSLISKDVRFDSNVLRGIDVFDRRKDDYLLVMAKNNLTQSLLKEMNKLENKLSEDLTFEISDKISHMLRISELVGQDIYEYDNGKKILIQDIEAKDKVDFVKQVMARVNVPGTEGKIQDGRSSGQNHDLEK